MPFLRLPEPPQSTAARSMPTPQQSPLQRLQRGNLLLHKIVTACKSFFYIHCSTSGATSAIPEAAKATTINGSPSMPTPQQSPLLQSQRENLPLHKIVTACKSTRSPGMGAALFYVSISIVR